MADITVNVGDIYNNSKTMNQIAEDLKSNAEKVITNAENVVNGGWSGTNAEFYLNTFREFFPKIIGKSDAIAKVSDGLKQTGDIIADFQEAAKTAIDNLESGAGKIQTTVSNAIKNFDVPQGDFSMKRWMPYTAIKSKNTKQYEMQQTAYTDENGFRRTPNGDYMVAMGSYYTEGEVGKRYEITLQNKDGSLHTITAVAGDQKQDIDTNSSNQYSNGANPDIVEFIIDSDKLNPHVRSDGGVRTSSWPSGKAVPELAGNVVGITEIA